jgi:hypothetical protein
MPDGKPEFAAFHVNAGAEELHPFDLKKLTLQRAGAIREQNPAAAAQHSLP